MVRTPLAAAAMAVLLNLGCGAALLAAAPDAHAQRESSWEIHSRMRDAHDRIDRNVSRGRLTPSEGRRLRAELDQIRDTEARMRRDGRLDRREREIIDRKLDRLSREISREVRR